MLLPLIIIIIIIIIILMMHLCITDMTVLAVLASSPVVGSSRNKMAGDVINSMPMLTRLRSPPDTPRTNSVPTCTGLNSIPAAFLLQKPYFKSHCTLSIFFYSSAANVIAVTVQVRFFNI